MVNTEKIVCPACLKSHSEDIYDLSEFDFAGRFDHECESCGTEFKVTFKFEPFVQCEIK